MKVIHPKLGLINVIIQFEGQKNQLALVTSSITQDLSWNNEGMKESKFGAKPKHWLLWGELGRDITEIGKTCLLNQSGSTYSQSKAVKTFMDATKYIDKLTIRKIDK
jgi:hypothetical protein